MESLRELLLQAEGGKRDSDRIADALSRENAVLNTAVREMRSDVDSKLSHIMDELIRYHHTCQMKSQHETVLTKSNANRNHNNEVKAFSAKEQEAREQLQQVERVAEGQRKRQNEEYQKALQSMQVFFLNATNHNSIIYDNRGRSTVA